MSKPNALQNMANEIENLDSLHEEKVIEADFDTLDDDARKEYFTTSTGQNKRLMDLNRQLFARAKKAEGFEQDKDGKWIKTGKEKEPPKPEAEFKPKPSSDVDFAQLAFHNTKSDALKVEHDEDVEFLRETLKETGKTQAAILGSKWFQSDLKERQELRITKQAIPSDSKRSPTAPSQQTPEYWIQRGEMPPDVPENRTLREKIVDLRYEKEKSAFGSPDSA